MYLSKICLDKLKFKNRVGRGIKVENYYICKQYVYGWSCFQNLFLVGKSYWKNFNLALNYLTLIFSDFFVQPNKGVIIGSADSQVYSQTWVNDHLRIATTCQKQPPFWSIILNFHYINDRWKTTTCQLQSLFFDPEGGRCTQVWLYTVIMCLKLITKIPWDDMAKFLSSKNKFWEHIFFRVILEVHSYVKIPRLKINISLESSAGE